MMQLGPEFDSVFRYIVVVAQRAEQLINGAKVRSQSRHVKPTLQALDDVDAGLVTWRILTQEELDAQRQAIVEQFRAEVGADRMSADAVPRLRDVLPTGPAEAPKELAEVVTEERDDELSRLQRLLGLGERPPGDLEEEGLAIDVEDDEPLALDLEEPEPELDEVVVDRDDFVAVDEEDDGAPYLDRPRLVSDDEEEEGDEEGEGYVDGDVEPDGDEEE